MVFVRAFRLVWSVIRTVWRVVWRVAGRSAVFGIGMPILLGLGLAMTYGTDFKLGIVALIIVAMWSIAFWLDSQLLKKKKPRRPRPRTRDYENALPKFNRGIIKYHLWQVSGVATILILLGISVVFVRYKWNQKELSSLSENVTEGVNIELRVEASNSIKQECRAIDPKIFNQIKTYWVISSWNRLAPELYQAAWDNTFKKILVCDDSHFPSTSMNMTLSEHPYIAVSFQTTAYDHCNLKALVSAPITDGGFYFWGGEKSTWPSHPWTLSPPFWQRKEFGLLFHLGAPELRQFSQGPLPQWKVFEINDRDEALRMRIQVKGEQWIESPEF